MIRILAILAACSLTLAAADTATAGGQRGHVRQELKAKFDADHDGTLSEAERDAARTAISTRIKEKHPELFAKIDTNADGVLSRDEFRAAREQLKALRAQRREHKGGTGE